MDDAVAIWLCSVLTVHVLIGLARLWWDTEKWDHSRKDGHGR